MLLLEVRPELLQRREPVVAEAAPRALVAFHRARRVERLAAFGAPLPVNGFHVPVIQGADFL